MPVCVRVAARAALTVMPVAEVVEYVLVLKASGTAAFPASPTVAVILLADPALALAEVSVKPLSKVEVEPFDNVQLVLVPPDSAKPSVASVPVPTVTHHLYVVLPKPPVAE